MYMLVHVRVGSGRVGKERKGGREERGIEHKEATLMVEIMELNAWTCFWRSSQVLGRHPYVSGP